MGLPDWLRLLRIPFGERYINLALARGREALLVDSGMSYSVEPHILPALRAEGMQPADLDWLVNLHAHSDHIGGNAQLLESSAGRLRIACHKADAPYIREPVRVVRELYRMPEDHPQFQRNVDDCGKPAPVHLELTDGVVFDLGRGVKLEVVAAPGHSPGNIALWEPSSRTLIHGESVMGPPQRGDDGRLSVPFGFSPLIYRETLGRLAKLPIALLVPSHQEPMDGEGAAALIRSCLDGVETYIATVQRILDAGAANLEDIYAQLSRTYRLRSPAQIAELYRSMKK